MKLTKIVATISDKRCDVGFLRQLADAGMNVVRLNSAHLDRDGMKKIVDNVRRADERIAVMIDTKGPEIRTTVTATGEPIDFATGDIVEISGDPDGLTTRDRICLSHIGIATDVNPGNRLLIDDGELAFIIISKEGDRLTARAENDGRLGSRKTVNVPGGSISLPAVTERDRLNLEYAVSLGVDFVAHSFVRSASDVRAVRDILDRLGSEMKIISKIENQEGVDNFNDILNESYGIMIARGDLGIEVAAERIPGIQLDMINKCVEAHKPVIVATQMLHSMIEHPRPTRAEVSDVAGAVYQRADAMMLSGETASGKYPVEAVRTMAAVACEVERSLTSGHRIPQPADNGAQGFLARMAVNAETEVGVKGIITDAFSGKAARYIASFRGINPTFAICYSRPVQRWLSLSYGVQPYMATAAPDEGGRRPVEALKSLVARGLLRADDLVAYLSGSHRGASSLEIDKIELLYR